MSRRAEIWLLLFAGIKPANIIKMGYAKNSVYKFSKEMDEARKNIFKDLEVGVVPSSETDSEKGQIQDFDTSSGEETEE